MSGTNEPTDFGSFESIDAITMAQDLQWEIEVTDDPTEASLKAGAAIAHLYRMEDHRLQPGTFLTVQALGAIIADVELEGGGRATAQLEMMLVQGTCAGVAFLQHFGKPRIQTLYVGLRHARALETQVTEDGIWVSKLGDKTLVVPVLQIGSIATAA